MNNLYGIPDHLFNGTIPQRGTSWTLATEAGRMLTELEERYGQRDMSWTLLGVEFRDMNPMIWYPGGNSEPDPKHIAIKLSPAAFSNHKEAMYQLSHECVHLLSPQGKAGAPVLEEGLAKLYSMEIIERRCSHPHGQPYGAESEYDVAARHVLQLLQYDPQAIRRLRDTEPAFYRIKPATFADAGLDKVPQSLITELLRTF